jgi:hypothetical protein
LAQKFEGQILHIVQKESKVQLNVKYHPFKLYVGLNHVILYIKCSLLNDDCKPFSPKGTLSEGVTSELNEACMSTYKMPQK